MVKQEEIESKISKSRIIPVIEEIKETGNINEREEMGTCNLVNNEILQTKEILEDIPKQKEEMKEKHLEKLEIKNRINRINEYLKVNAKDDTIVKEEILKMGTAEIRRKHKNLIKKVKVIQRIIDNYIENNVEINLDQIPKIKMLNYYNDLIDTLGYEIQLNSIIEEDPMSENNNIQYSPIHTNNESSSIETIVLNKKEEEEIEENNLKYEPLLPNNLKDISDNFNSIINSNPNNLKEITQNINSIIKADISYKKAIENKTKYFIKEVHTNLKKILSRKVEKCQLTFIPNYLAKYEYDLYVSIMGCKQ